MLPKGDIIDLSPNSTFTQTILAVVVQVFCFCVLYIGVNHFYFWISGANTITLQEPVDWKAGEEIVIASTSYEPTEAEKHIISAVSSDKKTLTLTEALKFKHLGDTHKTGNWEYTLAAEVGLLTRNIVIEGAEDAKGSLSKQSYGCRVLVGRRYDKVGRGRIENAAFKHCGQEGWTDFYDPRYPCQFK